MLPEVIEACDEHETGVRGLFAQAGLSIREEAWRALSADPEVPSHLRTRPLVAVTAGRVSGFVHLTHRHLVLDGDRVPAQVLSEFLVLPDEEGAKAARRLLEALPLQARVTFAGGWSHKGVAFLREWQWRYVGPIPRMIFHAPRQTSGIKHDSSLSARPAQPLPNRLLTANQLLQDDNLVFLEREPKLIHARVNSAAFAFEFLTLTDIPGGDGEYMILRKVPSALHPEGELHLTDLALTGSTAERAANLLRDMVKERGLPIIISNLHAALSDAASKLGAVPLEPRWGLFWCLGGPQYRRLGESLTARPRWHISPADLELDLY